MNRNKFEFLGGKLKLLLIMGFFLEYILYYKLTKKLNILLAY